MGHWTRLGLVMAATGAALWAGEGQCAERVKAWEDTMTISTYPWEPEDVNPRFFEYEGSVIYPYTMQDNLSSEKVDRTYKALHLENEYLQVTCLPELGGRIHSVLDKTTGQEMFHLNRVIKPGLIAMRGAWISGGIEWNSGPHGHTVTIVSPVDATVVENYDGSASLFIGNTEKIFRTRWTVKLTLRPGKAYLEENIRIFNPTDGPRPYYFWNNTAFPNRPGTRFIYPMTLGTDHSAVSFFSWPIHEGRDLTWLKNYPDMTSIFAYNCTFDFFGAYDVDADRGIVQFANHAVLPGKKAWTWGQADFGLVSQEALTDGDGPYIEVQSGPLATQSDYEFLAPRQQVAWEEWWYPVHGLGDGFEFATRDLAIQTARRDGANGPELEVRVLATGDFPGAKCHLLQGHAILHTETADLSPAAPHVVRFSPAPEKVDIVVTSQDHAVLARYATPLAIPKVEAPVLPEVKPEEALSVEERYLKGLRAHKDTNRTAARAGYEAVLQIDPQHAEALRGLAILDLDAGLYEKAAERLEQAVARRPADSLSWALLAFARLRLDRLEEALDAGYRGARLLDAAPLALDVTGRARMLRGEFGRAIADFRRALLASPYDTRTGDRLMLTYLRTGQAEEARELAAERVRVEPLALLPRMVLAMPDRERMQRAIRETQQLLGEDEFELLDTAFVCVDAGMPELARTLLDLADRQAFSPLTAYHQAYFADLEGAPEEAEAALKAARQGSPDYVFPSFPESVEALRFAVEKEASDGRARLYLGNLYAGLGRMEEAVPLWEEAVRLEPDLGVAYRNLAMDAWKRRNDLAAAESLLAKAIEARSDDELLYRDRAQVLLALDRRQEAIDLLAARPTGTTPRADATLLLVRAYVDEKRYDDALHVLESTLFNNFEGQTESWDLFNRARVERGKLRFEAKEYEAALEDFSAALTYPENLRVGRPVHPREAEAQYWKGRALHALGRTGEAREAWTAGTAGDSGSDVQNEHRERCAEALELLGNA